MRAKRMWMEMESSGSLGDRVFGLLAANGNVSEAKGKAEKQEKQLLQDVAQGRVKVQYLRFVCQHHRE